MDLDFSETTLIFFYTTWGLYSQHAKLEWEKIRDIGYAIDFVEYNLEIHGNLELLRSKYYIFDLPTMVLVKDNQTIKYDGCIITETGVTKWLDSLDVPYYEPPVMK